MLARTRQVTTPRIKTVPWDLFARGTGVVRPKPGSIDWSYLPPERWCVFCGHGLTVSLRAINTRCPKCSRHMLLQNLHLKGPVNCRTAATAGGIYVDPLAVVHGSLLALQIRVAGTVRGDVSGLKDVHIESSAKVAGKIRSRSIRVDPGAEIYGEIERIF